MSDLVTLLRALAEGKRILYPNEAFCPKCWGKGRVFNTAATLSSVHCWFCNGKGIVRVV